DHGVGKIQVVYGFGNVTRLLRVQLARLTFSNGAKTAVTSANVAAKHERRRAVGPTLENVRTARFLTNRMQIETFDQLQHLVLICRIAEADAEPFRFRLTYLLIVTDYSKFAGQ